MTNQSLEDRTTQAPDAGQSRAEFDHLIVFVNDPAPIRRLLAVDWGLNIHPDTRQFGDGVANLIVPLEPPQYLEVCYVVDRSRFVAAAPQAFIDLVDRVGGLSGWALRTPDLAAIEMSLGATRDAMDPNYLADGSVPGWSVLEKPGDPLGYPFYIQYADPPESRLARWQERLREVRHRQRPSAIQWVEVSSLNLDDLRAWLLPASGLDIRVLEGAPSFRAMVQIGNLEMVLSSDQPGAIVPS